MRAPGQSSCCSPRGSPAGRHGLIQLTFEAAEGRAPPLVVGGKVLASYMLRKVGPAPALGTGAPRLQHRVLLEPAILPGPSVTTPWAWLQSPATAPTMVDGPQVVRALGHSAETLEEFGVQRRTHCEQCWVSQVDTVILESSMFQASAQPGATLAPGDGRVWW